MKIVGVDVGGTFTDLVEFDEETGSLAAWKVPSTGHDPSRAIVMGLDQVVGGLEDIRRVIHGTTVATNAILERKGAKVAVVTTAGFRDVVELGRTQRIQEGGMFNPRFRRQEPVVPRALRFEVDERLDAAGRVLKPVRAEDVKEVAAKVRDAGADALAICLLHSYRNPEHELAVERFLRDELPDVFISISSGVVREYREFERFSTTVLNAYVAPVMKSYLNGFEAQLSKRGYSAPVYTMSSNGGIMGVQRAGDMAILTVLSGPVGGVNGAIAAARLADTSDIITCDMGGTSTDVALVRDLVPSYSTESTIAGFPLRTPHTDINTVGAGGGSIAWFDGTKIQVGPESAGAAPGPACYGQGGTEPTVTDANVALGRIGTERRLGRSIEVAPVLAREALGRLAETLGGMDVDRLAEGILKLAVARMTASIREISVERGHDPRDFALVAFGGAGPMHGTQVAEHLGIERVIIPQHPGNLSALGLLMSDLKHDGVETALSRLADADEGELDERFDALGGRARDELLADGLAESDIVVRRSLDLRYRGQAFELNVPVRGDGDLGPDVLRRAFDAAHQRTYGHSEPGAEVELVNLRVAAYGSTTKPAASRLEIDGESHAAQRPVYFDGRYWDTPVHERSRLAAGTRVAGPAVIEEDGATTVLLPKWTAEIDSWGNVIATYRN